MKSKSYYPTVVAAFTGKTVVEVLDDTKNSILFKFDDGSECRLSAECGTSDNSIPFFDVE